MTRGAARKTRARNRAQPHARAQLCERTYAGVMEAPGQQVVVLSKVFAGDINAGYQELANVQARPLPAPPCGAALCAPRLRSRAQCTLPPHAHTRIMHAHPAAQLLRVNGVDVVGLGHAAALLGATEGPFAVLELEWNKARARARAWTHACMHARTHAHTDSMQRIRA